MMDHRKPKYKISICIPTYNYGKYLQRNLETLTQENYFNLCEILIGDSGSTDDTEVIVKKFTKQYDNIQYHNFTKKLGIDIDLKKTSDLCSGEYIWFLSADDVPTKGCIARILSDITSQPTCLLYDRIVCDYFLNIIKKSRWSDFDKAKTIEFTDTENHANYLASLSSIGGLFSFMSVIVINRNAWLNVNSDDVPVAQNYQHVVRILRILHEPECCLSIPCFYLVYFRGGNDSFSSFGAFTRLMIDLRGYRRIIRMYQEEKIISKLKQVMRREHRWYYLPKFLVNIAGRNQTVAVGYLDYFGYSRFQIVLALTISRLSGLVGSLRVIRRIFIKIIMKKNGPRPQ